MLRESKDLSQDPTVGGRGLGLPDLQPMFFLLHLPVSPANPSSKGSKWYPTMAHPSDAAIKNNDYTYTND